MHLQATAGSQDRSILGSSPRMTAMESQPFTLPASMPRM